MATKNPQQVAAKWSRNLGAATESIRTGVQAVTESPTSKAAARVDAYVQGVTQAAADGRFQRGLNRVTLADWQQAFLQKGLPRIATGASAAVPKMEEFMAEFLPFVDAGVRRLPARGDIEANLQRSAEMARYLHTFRRRS